MAPLRGSAAALNGRYSKDVDPVLDDHADTFIEYHDLRTRHVGSKHAVDLHLVVPSDMSVAAAHDLSTHLEDEIADVLPQSDVVIHVEPENEAATSVAPPAADAPPDARPNL